MALSLKFGLLWVQLRHVSQYIYIYIYLIDLLSYQWILTDSFITIFIFNIK